MLKCSQFESLQRENENRLERFLDFLELLTCKRCWRERHKIGKPYHHHGGLLYFLGQPPFVTNEDFQKWVSDTDHGFFHGLMTAFFCFSLADGKKCCDSVCVDASDHSVENGTAEFKTYEEKTLAVERLFYSCLFHDFVKSTRNAEPHDRLLKQFFPMCVEDAYSHAEPKTETPLVIADRLELLRYGDWESWVDEDRIRMTEYGQAELRHFYQHIRPCLSKIMKSSEEPWISHNAETKDRHVEHYPEHHWIAQDDRMSSIPDVEQYISVNSGYLPFVGCHAHTYLAQKDRRSEPTLVGLVSMHSIIESGNEVTHAPASTWGRDHLFLKIEKPLSLTDWVFVYHKQSDLDLIELSKSGVIRGRTLNRFFEVQRNLRCKIRLLKVR